MHVAILSDIHDQKENLAIIINQIKKQDINQAIVLGDFCAPPTVKQLVESGLRCRCIYGNNDGDRSRMLLAAQASDGRVTFSTDEFDQYTIESRQVFVTHYPKIAQGIAASGQYDTVFYGHDHKAYQEKLDNDCLLLNPGEVWGWLRGTISYAVWDTKSNTAEIIEVGPR